SRARGKQRSAAKNICSYVAVYRFCVKTTTLSMRRVTAVQSSRKEPFQKIIFTKKPLLKTKKLLPYKYGASLHAVPPVWQIIRHIGLVNDDIAVFFHKDGQKNASPKKEKAPDCHSPANLYWLTPPASSL